MLKLEKNYISAPKQKLTHNGIAFWTPHPQNSLFIDKELLIETKRNASVYRSHLLNVETDQIKKSMVNYELDKLMRDHLKRSNIITRDLEIIENMVDKLQDTKQTPPYSQPPLSPTTQPTLSNAKPNVYTITVAPGDPGFTVEANFKLELVSSLYTNQQQWLPSYGPWYSSLTDIAMQRRIFPKELKGSLNFQNSTSLKLMHAVLTTISSATEDFYSDVRHLSDTNAALVILNAYFCLKTSAPLPVAYEELLNNLEAKLDLFVSDLKTHVGDSGFSFFPQANEATSSIAPLNRDTKYSHNFFKGHKIYSLLETSGLLSTKVTHVSPKTDIIYSITSEIFGEDIPPMASFQWNLRVGIIAIEVLVVTYLLLEISQISLHSTHRRLNLAALLGSKFKKSSTVEPNKILYKKGQVFSFLSKNYIVPTLTNNPNVPISFLFPGVTLIALESLAGPAVDRPFINLTGNRFQDIFEIINQKFTFKDPESLMAAHTAFRLKVEHGLGNILSNPSPTTFATEIIKHQFGGEDNYDTLYFIVLGYLPIAWAAVQ
ncbi:virion tegument protein [Ateline gammaherpesvirus 3]|uniref:Virion tegument protein n=1 Tax=Ateline herpesvirus 3 TaxID=85618 RepID=Q9YTP7_ATHV3|nr:virion tegument protein [Ateline gammaherpesvirus 3]AAC95543.1 virion tegument protein [Ateline gammaherpesvirus 3]